MTYPPNPGPPQYPGQPHYPGQQPYPGQPPQVPSGQFPAQPYPQAPYPSGPLPPQKPSGGTAITAGVLAVLGGLLFLLFTVATIIGLANLRSVLPIQVIGLVEYAVVAGTLLPGGILLFLKKPAGRMLTIIGCGISIVGIAVNLVLVFTGVGEIGTGFGRGVVLGALLVIVPAVATLVLAIVKPTARWCGVGEPQVIHSGISPYPGPPQAGRPPGW
jgi:hypothetical protein